MFVMSAGEFDWLGNPSSPMVSGYSSTQNRRGYANYSFSQLMGITGVNKHGESQYVQYEQPLFILDPVTRVEIFQTCSPILGVITTRMNRISGMSFDIVPDRQQEDRIAEELKVLKQIYDEHPVDNFYSIGVKMGCSQKIRQELWDVLPDMSNFNQALLRWKRRITSRKLDEAQRVHDWLMQPNQKDTWDSFIKKYVMDLHLHGATSIYKEVLNRKIENIYILPGGSVYPVQSRFIGSYSAFIQLSSGLRPQIFYPDEVSFDSYIPSSVSTYGHVPIDALVNKIAESLFFDRLMAEQADGTRPPEKILVFGEQMPLGDIGTDNFDSAIDPSEQKRIEHIVNEYRKSAVRVLSGYGQPFVLDLTRENIMSTQMERQNMIKQDIALVFNMSNMEINESGGDGTSGRNTADAQERIENAKGTLPITKSIENMFNFNILPFRFGGGYRMKYQTQNTDVQKAELVKLKMETGIYAVNEIRVNDENLDPIGDPQYDIPPNTSPMFPEIIAKVQDTYNKG